ncbi:MAG: SpoIIE family protein phosphatase [Coriobacteriia bacterium]|nr:SpoIIE family protein phosphatase [Coriobacteriia bacterium]
MNGARHQTVSALRYLPAVLALVTLAGTRLVSYELFHSVAGLFVVAVEFSLFTVVWHSRRNLDNGVLVLIGSSAAAVATVDAAHLLLHNGLLTVSATSAAAPLQVWTAGRIIHALSLLAATGFIDRKPIPWVVLATSMSVAGAIIAAIVFGVLPATLAAPAGSPSSIGASAFVVAALTAAYLRLARRADRFYKPVARMMNSAVACMAASEIVLAASVDPTGITGLVGHLLRVVAAYAFYRAVVLTALEEPQAVIFREISLRNALLEETERALRLAKERSDAMSTVSAMIARGEPLDTIIAKALELGCETLGADGAALTSRTDAGWLVTHVHGFDRSIIGMRRDAASARHLHLAAEKGAPVIMNDPLRDPRVDDEFVSRFGISALLVAPLMAGNEALGTITFVTRKSRGTFDEQDRAFAARLSTALGLATANERLRSAQLRVAGALQTAILTMPDSLPGLRLGHVYRSADRLARIGGDFYDAFPIAEHKHAVLMGDVSGKGVDAAISSFVTRTAFHALALREQSPARVMSAVNDVLSRLLPDEAFATAIFGVLDARQGTFTACSAGHPDPVVCIDGACVEFETTRSLPLGMFSDARYEEFEIPLAPGHVLVMFSDGVLEARRGTDAFGETRVRQVLASTNAADPQVVAESLLAAVTAHSDGVRLDDIAVVALCLC